MKRAEFEIGLGQELSWTYQFFDLTGTDTAHRSSEPQARRRDVCHPTQDERRHQASGAVGDLRITSFAKMTVHDQTFNEPLSSMRVSCSTTSAISFFSCSRLLASFLCCVI